VVGTVDIAGDDPELDQADAYVRGLVESSLGRPVVAREKAPPYRTGRSSRGRQRG
jgi:hypothetical protein